jgi:hypothetical protein
MLAKTPTLVCAAIAALSLAQVARANTQAETETEAAPAPAATGEAAQLTLPKGRLLLDAFLEINLSDGAVFKPFSLSPDVWYGATDDITVGLIHSAVGASGFIGGVGTSLCLAGTGGNCADVYPGFGVDVRYKLKNGELAWAADAGLYVRDFSPFQLAIKLGAVGRWHKDKIAVELAPNLFFGVTNRDASTDPMVVSVANQETLNLPVTALYAINPKVSAALQTGLVLPFQATGDSYAVPLSLGGHYHLNESVNLNLALSFPALIGGGSQTGIDARTVTLGGTYAF